MASTATHHVRKRPNAAKKSRVSNAKLLKLTAKHRPPQAWFEQTDIPFTPTNN